MNQPQQVAEEFLRAIEDFNHRVLALGFGEVSKFFWYHVAYDRSIIHAVR